MKLIVLGIIAILVVGYTAFTIFRPGNVDILKAGLPGTQKIESAEAEPIRAAKKLYEEKKKANEDFDQSMCLSQDVGDGWAVDIVHNPRTVKDDENKCESFEQGRVAHLIEMTPDGKIVRAE